MSQTFFTRATTLANRVSVFTDGSDQQIEAENELFEIAEEVLTSDRYATLEDDCHKATAYERAKHALRAIAEVLS